MPFLFTFLLIGKIKCEGSDDEDFWANLEENDQDKVEVIDKVEGKTYDKARFNLPIARRLNSLFPDVARAVRDLQDVSQMEFVYEEKFPILYFLDSQDVVVEKIEIGKKSKDEIKALLTMRGFDLNLKKAEKEKKEKHEKNVNTEAQQNNVNAEETHNAEAAAAQAVGL